MHTWLRRYAAEGGLGGWVIGRRGRMVCPHQMSPAVEARVVEMRRAHPGWGADRIRLPAGAGRGGAGAGPDQYLSGAGA